MGGGSYASSNVTSRPDLKIIDQYDNALDNSSARQLRR